MAKPEWIFGLHTVSALLEHQPERVLELFLLAGRDDNRIQQIQSLAKRQGIALQTLSRKRLDELSRQYPEQASNHQGVVARCRLAEARSEQDLQPLLEQINGAGLLLVLDNITDPHNLGACLRSADAAGVNAVITTKNKAVGLTPIARRVAVGAAETVPFFQVTNLARTLKELQQQGYWLVGSAIEPSAKSLYEVDLTGNIALIMGAEGQGLRRLTQELCDTLAYIPMHGSVDSLNVSVATGVCLFEAVRQRHQEP